MPSYLPKDFEPRPEDYAAAGISQIPRDFLDVVVTPEFTEYWTELKYRKLKKGKKDAWYTTWRNRARFLWKIKGPAWEENRHKRQDSGSNGDFFGDMLDKINGSEPSAVADDKCLRRPTAVMAPKTPGLGPGAAAMSPEEAFAELKKMKIIK